MTNVTIALGLDCSLISETWNFPASFQFFTLVPLKSKTCKPHLNFLFRTSHSPFITLLTFETNMSQNRFALGIKGEVRLVDRCFHLGDCALAEAMKITKHYLENQACKPNS
jgi:hypothetical protein